MKIFASYEHDKENSTLKRDMLDYLFDALQKKGHYIWYYQNELHSGQDWRAVIDREIHDTDITIVFLNKFEKGEKSACLGEIAIARSIPGMRIYPVLLEKEKDPKERLGIPATLSMNIYFDMSNLEANPVIQDTPNEYIDQIVEKLLDWINNPEERKKSDDLEQIFKCLLLDETIQTKYTHLLETKMEGRGWLKDHLATFHAAESKDKLFLISGGAGTGKSRFIAEAMHDDVGLLAGFFFEYTSDVSAAERNLKRFVCSMAYQIANHLGQYRLNLLDVLREKKLNKIDRLEKNQEYISSNSEEVLFDELILKPLTINIDGGLDPMAIYIDAIDEAVAVKSSRKLNPIVQLLSADRLSKLPSWVRIVFTCRSEDALMNQLAAVPAVHIDLGAKESDTDLIEYFEKHFSDELATGQISKVEISHIVERCERTFIYAELFWETYQKDPTILDDIEKIPFSLSQLYTGYFQRAFPEQVYPEHVEKVLEVLLANGGHIPVDLLEQILHGDSKTTKAFLEAMRSFVICGQDRYTGDLSFYHKAFHEWLIAQKYATPWYVDIEKGKDAILQFSMEYIAETDDFIWMARSCKEMDFCYGSISKCGYSSDRKIRDNNIRFLFFLQRQHYNSSEYNCSHKYYDMIQAILMKRSSGEHIEAEYLKYLPWSEDIEAEIEIAYFHWDAAKAILENAKQNYADILKEEFGVYSLIERNLAFCQKDASPEKAKEMLLNLEKEINKWDDDNEYDLIQLWYHLCVICYNQGQKAPAEYDEAIRYGMNSLEKARDGREDRRGITTKVNNQLGAIYAKLGDFDTSNQYYQTSLNERLSYYGTNSTYTALGFQALAKSFVDLAESTGSLIENKAVDYADESLRIYNLLLGEDSTQSAMTKQVLARIYLHLGMYNEALNYAMEALPVLKNAGSSQVRAVTYTEDLIDRIKAKITK